MYLTTSFVQFSSHIILLYTPSELINYYFGHLNFIRLRRQSTVNTLSSRASDWIVLLVTGKFDLDEDVVVVVADVKPRADDTDALPPPREADVVVAVLMLGVVVVLEDS